MIERAARAAARVAGWPLTVRGHANSAEAIVVLGAPPTRTGQVSRVCAERVAAAFALWRAGAAPKVLITGGPHGPGGVVEADVMGTHALALGLPEEALVLEREALTTEQNAAYIAALLPAGARVWLVTTPFHSRRSAHLFRRAGLQPIPYHIDDSLQYRNPRLAVRWIAREYGAWVWMGIRRLRG